MIWIIFVYALASGVLSIGAGTSEGILVGIAFAAGSALAVAAGGELRASLLGPTKQKVRGSVIAGVLLALGLLVGTQSSGTLFGVYVSGPVWVLIGTVVCLLFVGKRRRRV